MSPMRSQAGLPVTTGAIIKSHAAASASFPDR